MKYRKLKFLAALSIAFVIQGCGTKSPNLYYWGDYQSVIYDIYLNPGEADAQTQIYKLNQTIERAENKGMKIPPGVFAHLGMVHAQIGNAGLAKEALLQEKALYPESATFIDGILARSKLDSLGEH
jgi:hypothetical protein